MLQNSWNANQTDSSSLLEVYTVKDKPSWVIRAVGQFTAWVGF